MNKNAVRVKPLNRSGSTMKLFLADIRDVKTEYINLLDKERADRANRCKIIDDKKRCIAAGLLIKRFFGNAEIKKNAYGKPFAESGNCFNISHSGNYILFAVSNCEVGCDIQLFGYVNSEKIGKAVFSDAEAKLLAESTDKLGAFFEFWTKKESLLKCIGEGFHRSAKSVDVSGEVYEENDKKYYFRTWLFSDYTLSVCSLKNDFPRFIEFISLKDIV